MAYSPASNPPKPPLTNIDAIAEECVKEIRHMTVITHDPEGQRIKKLVIAACQQSFQLALPKNDGKTTHVTTDKDIQFKVEGIREVKDAKIVQEAMQPYFGLCHTCEPPAIHDPRGTYDHAPVPLRRTG